jgi:hypothetical protein
VPVPVPVPVPDLADRVARFFDRVTVLPIE